MKIYYSCVIDTNPKFQYQCWLWAHSLIELAQISPSNIWVHYISGVDLLFIEKLKSLGLQLQEIEGFGDYKYCNKIAQLSNDSLREADVIILMDTDMIITQNFMDTINLECVSGKIVDYPNPNISILDNIFLEAGLDNIYERVKTDFENELTYAGNFNGGLYIIPNQYIDMIQASWRKWASWLLENNILKDGMKVHVDQVSFCMTIHENQIPIEHLPRTYNYPIHINFHKDIAPMIIHYHWKISNVGLLNIDQNSSVPYKECISKINDFIGRHFDNMTFWNYRYTVFPELGSGVGSRAENLKVKQTYACDVKFDRSFWARSFHKLFIEEVPELIGKKIYLHIGTPKTGTSSLQKYLYNNRNELIKQRVLYSDDVVEYRHQHLVTAMLNDDWLGFIDFFKSLVRKTKNIESIQTLIISSEGFYNHTPDFSEASKLFWQVISEILDLKVVVYLRRQEDFIESYYRQCVINPKNTRFVYGQQLVIEEFIETDRIKAVLDYETNLDAWSTIVGNNNLIVRSYTEDVNTDFLELLKINSAGFTVALRENKSLPAIAVEIIRRSNAVLDEKSQQLLVREVKDIFRTSDRYEKFVNNDLRQHLINKYKDEYDRLVEKWPSLMSGKLAEKGDEDIHSNTKISSSKQRSLKHLIRQIYDFYIIKRSGLFNKQYYLDQNPDVAKASIHPILHYVRYGVAENRNPSEQFNTFFYLKNNEDVINAGLNPFAHYIRFGQFEGRETIEKKNEIEFIERSIVSSTGAPNDMSTEDVKRAMQVVEYPHEFVEIVNASRALFGWYTKHFPRVYEYPWLLNKLKENIRGKKIADFGAGLTPMPIILAEHGAIITTIDNHPKTRSLQGIENDNEWGFFDYSQVNHSITSYHLTMDEHLFPDKTFDIWYSISVIEHMPAEMRREIIKLLKKSLKDHGRLMLTVDLAKDTNLLWNYAEGEQVEPIELHGSLQDLEQELIQQGFIINEARIIKQSQNERIDIALIDAYLSN